MARNTAPAWNLEDMPMLLSLLGCIHIDRSATVLM